MKSVLWMQNESTEIQPTTLIDGIICTDKDKAQEAFSLLNFVNQDLSMSPEQREKLYNKFKNKNYTQQANFTILQSPYSGVYLQGAYLDRDVVGRQMPYMFYDSTTASIEEAISNLKMISETCGRHVNDFELDVFRKLIKKKSGIYFKIAVMVILVILCILYLMR